MSSLNGFTASAGDDPLGNNSCVLDWSSGSELGLYPTRLPPKWQESRPKTFLAFDAERNQRQPVELPGARPHYNPDRPGQAERIALELSKTKPAK